MWMRTPISAPAHSPHSFAAAVVFLPCACSSGTREKPCSIPSALSVSTGRRLI